jgi:hypothetical protein
MNASPPPKSDLLIETNRLSKSFAGGASKYGLGVDFIVLAAIAAAMTVIAARIYPRLTM